MASPAGPEVRVTGGSVRGALESGVAVFRGIPYAEPPARFAAPEPVPPWTATREALEFGPPPPQSGLFGTASAADSRDGWLTVNVWTPDLDAELPVTVWVQGGGYLFGTSGLPEYDGARLAREGGVVVVTFNYRTGLEGFAQVEGAPPNRGLLDQVAALEWVRDDIGAFGGDPERVTVFGESAGGGSVAALLAMPRAAGLFRRAVVQSMPGTYLTTELATDIAGVVATGLGLASTAELASVPPHELPAAADALMAEIERYADRWGRVARRRVPVAPVVDGSVLPLTPGGRWPREQRATSSCSWGTPATSNGSSAWSRASSARSPTSRPPPRWTCSRPVRRPRRSTARPVAVRRSCTTRCTPTGCSGCPRCTSPRHTPGSPTSAS